jgi:phospholipase/carboxylesterase
MRTPHRLSLGLWVAVCLLPVGCEAPPPSPRTSPATSAAQSQKAEPAPVDEEVTQPELPPLPAVAGIHYLELVTGGADPDAELPMIVAIHGLGDQPRGFVGLFQGFDRPARIILPRAIDEYEPGYSWFPIRAADPDRTALADGIARAADAIAPAIQELSESRPTRGKPIVTGFSQGGMLTFTLATRHPELFAYAVAVGGWLPPPLWPESAPEPTSYPPIIALHGDADPAVRIEPTRESVAHLESIGLRAELHEYSGVGHSIPPPMRDELLYLLGEALPPAAEGPRKP